MSRVTSCCPKLLFFRGEPMGREVVSYQMMEHKIRLTSVLSLHVNTSGYVHEVQLSF